MKNALIPVVTFIGIDLGAMLAGAILTETVFNWPGIGYATYRAILARDYPVVFGCTIVILLAVMVVNLAVDISYAFLDPRIRYGVRREGVADGPATGRTWTRGRRSRSAPRILSARS